MDEGQYFLEGNNVFYHQQVCVVEILENG